MRKLVAAVLGLSFLTCATPAIVPVSFPLQYRTEAAHSEFPAPMTCGMVSRIVVDDGRPTQILGARHPQDAPAHRAPVEAVGNVAAWAGVGAEAMLNQNGIRTRGAGPALHLLVNGISTDESTFYNAEYAGNIAIGAELVSPGGNSCWKGTVEGYAQNYGYAGSPVNYMETLNHALDRSMIKMIADPAFRAAVCHCS